MPLLGEDLDLRRITWRLPPETIPRLSGSSHLSSDTEGLLREEDGDVATGSPMRSGTPRPQAGEGRLHMALSVLSRPALSQGGCSWVSLLPPPYVPVLPLA